ncbi:MAG: NEW3 domain-containing protein [Phycisphaerae bacterium]
MIRVFDFDERPLGNFEDTPMHWERLTGPGLPAFARGRFDDELGHDAPPSFRFDLRGVNSNIGYQYERPDLVLEPGCDYRVSAAVRAEGLVHARAFLALQLLDVSGAPLPDEVAVSNLVRTGPDGSPTDWQRVDIDFSTPDAYAVRLRLLLWVVQAHVWRPPPENQVAPITLQDVAARVWFDDVVVRRMPRMRIELSHPANVFREGAPAALRLRVGNAPASELSARLTLADARGETVHADEQTLAGDGNIDSSFELPALAIGRYGAQIELRTHSASFLSRTLCFAVTPELRRLSDAPADVGLDLARWLGPDPVGARDLLRDLGARSVKLTVPIADDPFAPARARQAAAVRRLVRELIADRVETIGVLAPPLPVERGALPESLRARLAHEVRWRERSAPVLTDFAGMITTWQVGDERAELRDPTAWTAADIDAVRAHLTRYVSIPELVVPQPVLAAPRVGRDISSTYLSDDAPSSALAAQLAWLADDAPGRRWLRVATPREPDADQRVAELARRAAIAKALDPERVYLDAPLRVVDSSGTPQWEPAEDYLVIRTLSRYLSGARPAGALRLAGDGVALVFRDEPGATTGFAVAWTAWAPPATADVELYLGDAPSAVELTGATHPLTVSAGRTRVTLRATPIILDRINVPLVLLHGSLRLAPTYVEAHTSEPSPRLSFRNHFAEPLGGVVTIAPPSGWSASPAQFDVTLAPGETLEREISLRLPPRQVAATRPLSIVVHLRTPLRAELRVDAPITVGLTEILTEASARWVGDDLVVEQSVRNLSSQAVSFTAFCDAPARPRQERAFLAIGPGDEQSQSYVFPAARGLAGVSLRCSIEEIRGTRRLDQLVALPPVRENP